VSLWSESAIHHFLVDRAAALGRTMDVRIQVAGFAAVLSLVRAGAGIAVLPRSVLRPLHADALAVLALDERWAPRRLSLCSPRDRARITDPARALLAALRQRSDAGTPPSRPAP